MKKPIDELTELAHKCDDVTMNVMDSQAFEKYFASIYGTVNHFHRQQHLAQDSVPIIQKAYHLLDAAIQHHRKKEASVTEESILIFNKTVQLLLSILSIDLSINERAYANAKEINLRLRALKACGINPPGHYPNQNFSKWREMDKELSDEAEALHYALENIKEFTIFVYELAESQEFIRDPFYGTELSEGLLIYEKVSSLLKSNIMIERGKAQFIQ